MALILVFNPASYSSAVIALPYFLACVVFLALGAVFWPIGRGRLGYGTLAILSVVFAVIALAHAMLALAVNHSAVVFWLRVLTAALTLLPVAGAHVFHKFLRPRLIANPLMLVNWVVSSVLATASALGPLAPDQAGSSQWSKFIAHEPLLPLIAAWTLWIAVGVGRDFAVAYPKPVDDKTRRHRVYTVGLFGVFVIAGGLSFLPRLGAPIPPFTFIPALIFLTGVGYVLTRYPKPGVTPELVSQNIVTCLRDGLLALDQNGVIRLANPAAARLLERSRRQLMGQPARLWFGRLAAPERLERAAKQRGANEHELPLKMSGSPSSRTISLSIDAVNSPQVTGTAFILLFRDITEKKRLQNRVLQEGVTDPLTGFPNRELFVQILEQTVVVAQGSAAPGFAVFFLNLDRFKTINDTAGTVVGDNVLLAVADRLRRCLSPGNVLARLGGDEFGILRGDVWDEESAREKANDFRDALAPRIRLEGGDIHVTASIGVVVDAAAYDRGDNLLRDANIAMAHAKAQGGGCHKVFAVEMRESKQRQARIESELRAAVQNRQLRAYYQPIVNVGEKRIVGFEALLRWEHPEQGVVSPDEFIHVAEETGLIVPMGRWLLGEVCRSVSEWGAMNGDTAPAVSINLSDQELKQPDLIHRLRRKLEEYGLTASSVHLEVTERMLMSLSGAEVLNQLVDTGVQLSIDDFGTGYSSLSRLQNVPVDILKVDRSFVSKMTITESGATLVRTIIQLAHNLGHHVIAEGVETREQLIMLQDMGCEAMQGHYFSPPVDERATRRLLADQSWLKRALGLKKAPEPVEH